MLRRLSGARERLILSHAKPALTEGEEVLKWVRVRKAGDGTTGFIYLTARSVVVYWSRIGSSPESYSLKELRSWGVDQASSRGPVLGIETASGSVFVEMLVGTEGMVAKVNDFLEAFAAYAPTPRGPLSESSHPADYQARRGLRVKKEKKTVATHTRRAAFSVLGIVILVAGIVLLFIPGPGILVVLLGLSILAREYDWAEDLMHWARGRYRNVADRLKERSHST
jgi:uncharacterized protein (TIGR02611 family)